MTDVSTNRTIAGFTLLEMLIALALIASIASAATLVFSKRISSLQGARELEVVVSSLRKARIGAMTSGSERSVEFDLVQRRLITIPDGDTLDLPADMEIEITVDQSLAADRRARILFFPDGSSTGGEFKIGFKEREYSIEVDWLTGLTQMKRRDSE